MNRRVITAIARKDGIDLLLNKQMLSVLLTSIVLAILLAFIGNIIGKKGTELLIYNPSHSPVEQVVISSFAQRHVTYATDPREVAKALGPNGAKRSSVYTAGLIVPENFESMLHKGQHPQVQFYINEDQNSSAYGQLMEDALKEYIQNDEKAVAPIRIEASTVNPPATHQTFSAGVAKQIFIVTAILGALMVGPVIIPGLIVEEKEKKTLRMLMVSPASWGDILMGKIIIGSIYLILLLGVIMTINQGFTGNIPIVILFAFLGIGLSIALGLLIGAFARSASTAGGISGLLSFIFIIPVFFTGVVGQLLGPNIFQSIVKILPTYFLIEGLSNAITDQVTISSLIVDGGILCGWIVILFIGSSILLYRQAAVASSI